MGREVVTTYAQLQADTARWLVREDLTADIPDFVVLCEAAMRRDLHSLSQEVIDDNFTINARTVPLPTDYIERRSISLNQVSEPRSLDYLPPNRLRSSKGFSEAGTPRAYTIEGQSITFMPEPTGTFVATLVYMASLTKLVNDADTNWILTNAYDIYLWGTCFQGSVFIEDVEKQNRFGGLYRKAVDDLNRVDQWSKISGSPATKTPAHSA